MPELPEVETIARNLRQGVDGAPGLVGLQVEAAQILWPRTIAMPEPADFERRIRGQVVTGVGRRGKYLLVYLSQDVLLTHLRMSGDVWLEPSSTPLAVHHRVLIEFTAGNRLVFNDTRKFGRMWLVAEVDQVLAGLGPEPFDNSLTPERFHQALKSRRRQLKPLLLDQSFLAGLGNIYADEALHLARLHPLASADQLTQSQSGSLLTSIRQVLQAAIDRHGTSIDWVYRGGDYQKYLRVYQRAGEPCAVCGTAIERMVVGQRSTHYCPVCQELPSG